MSHLVGILYSSIPEFLQACAGEGEKSIVCLFSWHKSISIIWYYQSINQSIIIWHRCISALDELLELRVLPLMLKKQPDIVSTVRRLRYIKKIKIKLRGRKERKRAEKEGKGQKKKGKDRKGREKAEKEENGRKRREKANKGGQGAIQRAEKERKMQRAGKEGKGQKKQGKVEIEGKKGEKDWVKRAKLQKGEN